MKTVSKIVRLQGPGSLTEATELRATAEIQLLNQKLAKLEADFKAHVTEIEQKADRLGADIAQHATALAKSAEAIAQHDAKIVAAEAREIDRAAMTVLRRVWLWFTTYEGIV